MASLELFRRALAMVKREEDAATWAYLHFQMVNSLVQSPEGSRADNLEEAITHCEQALTVYTCKANPKNWAATQYHLAAAYRDRISGERSENLEEAIVHFQQALGVYSREADPKDWAGTHHNLANVYVNRFCGKQADNLKQAINHYQQALTVYTREVYPSEWAMIQQSLAIACDDRLRGERVDNRHHDEESSSRELEGHPDLPRELRATHLSDTRDDTPDDLGAIVQELSQPARSVQEMPRRIAMCRRALTFLKREEGANLWALLHEEMAHGLGDSLQGSQAENIDQAIEHYQQALTVITREADPEHWAEIQNSLAIAYCKRIHGERGDNLEQAIEHYQQALQVRTREADPKHWAETQNNLANAYSNRIRSERAENLELAISHYQRALTVYTQEADPENWAMVQRNLAVACGEHRCGERVEKRAHDEESFSRELGENPEAVNGLLAGLLSNIHAEGPDEITSILLELGRPASNTEEVSRRIELCRWMLKSVPKEEQAALWAAICVELANSLAQCPNGPRAKNLEEAISHYQQALTIYSREADPEQWSSINYNLANAYGNHISGERSENLEQAISHYHQALQVRTRETYPEVWALIQHNLAFTYGYRIRGDRAENVEQAIDHYQQALQVHTREAHPEEWGMNHYNLAIAYGDRIRGDRAENVELAIDHYQQALQVRTREAYPEEWGMTEHNLASAYHSRIRGERSKNLEQAISHYQQALRVRTREGNPKYWAMTQDSLGIAYYFRIHGDRAENLERAINHYQQALQVRTRETYPEKWAQTHHHLGGVYCDRISGKRLDNLERAISHYQQALQVRTREAYPKEWAFTQNNLGNVYCNLSRGGRAESHEQAIMCFQEALAVYTREAYPEEWAIVQNNLGGTYFTRSSGDRAENVEQAIDHYQQALQVHTREAYPGEWAQLQSNLGNAYSDRTDGEPAKNLDQAIKRYLQALQVQTLMHFPADFQKTQCNLGHLYFREGMWALAVTAYKETIRAEQVLLGGAYTEVGRQMEIAKTAELYSRTAYALLKLDCVGEALTQLDRGKTRLLSQALALDEVNVRVLPGPQQESLRSLRLTIRALETEMRLPPDTPVRRDDRVLAEALSQARAALNSAIEDMRATHHDFVPERLRLPEILALVPQNTALVAPVITSQGSAVFVIPDGLASVSTEHVLWINEFKETDLLALLVRKPVEEAQLSGWLGSYFNAGRDVKGWFDTIEATGQALWTHLMAPIADRLATLEVTQVLLMPQGELGLLPLHAAWRETDGMRRYFIDDYTVTYMPSAYAHKVSRERVTDAQRHERSLFAVINPTEDLPFTPMEGEQVAKLFHKGKTHVLPDAEATVKAVMKQAMVGYVHFSCHGFYQWVDPMQSGLLLADREPLTLMQIIGGLNLDNTRLVTLSACETGIRDIRQSPDEYVGLPAGFLQAGAPAVISTLWAVNDLSTMLLMERFYFLHLEEKLEIPKALCQSQRWLRDVTAGELAHRFAGEEEAMLSTTRMSIETTSEFFARFTAHDPKHRPFEHPYFWAPFTFSGV